MIGSHSHAIKGGNTRMPVPPTKRDHESHAGFSSGCLVVAASHIRGPDIAGQRRTRHDDNDESSRATLLIPLLSR